MVFFIFKAKKKWKTAAYNDGVVAHTEADLVLGGGRARPQRDVLLLADVDQPQSAFPEEGVELLVGGGRPRERLALTQNFGNIFFNI